MRYLVYQFDLVNPVYFVANIVIDFIVLKSIKNETLKIIEKMHKKNEEMNY